MFGKRALKEEMIDKFDSSMAQNASCSRQPIEPLVCQVLQRKNFIFPRKPIEEADFFGYQLRQKNFDTGHLKPPSIKKLYKD